RQNQQQQTDLSRSHDAAIGLVQYALDCGVQLKESRPSSLSYTTGMTGAHIFTCRCPKVTPLPCTVECFTRSNADLCSSGPREPHLGVRAHGSLSVPSMCPRTRVCLQVFVDTVGPAEKYEEKLSKRFPGVKVAVRPKADSLFPVVSAASICAKVARDHAVKDWTFAEDLGEVDTDYGSGYPNDPKTKSWLLKYLDPVFGYPQFVRFSWSTAQTLLDSKAFAVHWDDDEEDGEKGAARQKNTSMLSYFSHSKPKGHSPTHKTHRFFTERRLQNVDTF
ncbi:hypothetical protein P4O66_021556, partial [Electrophorus voltai]